MGGGGKDLKATCIATSRDSSGTRSRCLSDATNVLEIFIYLLILENVCKTTDHKSDFPPLANSEGGSRSGSFDVHPEQQQHRERMRRLSSSLLLSSSKPLVYSARTHARPHAPPDPCSRFSHHRQLSSEFFFRPPPPLRPGVKPAYKTLHPPV